MSSISYVWSLALLRLSNNEKLTRFEIAADTLMTFGGKVLSEEIEDTELLFKLNSVLNPPDATTINRRRQIFRFFLAVAACEHCLTIKYFR